MHNKKNEFLEWMESIAIALLVAFLLRFFVFDVVLVEGKSMNQPWIQAIIDCNKTELQIREASVLRYCSVQVLMIESQVYKKGNRGRRR